MKINCFTCKYGYEDERLGIPMCHHPRRFSEDCVNFNMHEEKESEHLANTRKTSPKDLEEASEKYGHNKHPMTPTGAEESQEDFIAGAKWQKEQDRLEIANIKAKLWQEGFNDCKEQMMKEAVEGKIVSKNDGWKSIELPSTFFGELSKNYKHGDKVRIIIIKEDER